MQTTIDINEIMKSIPHRYPFLLVDRIIEVGEESIVGVKNVTINEPFFQGHFPGHPIMPGVLILEALAQASGVLVLRKEEYKGKLAYFAAINNAKFRKPVVPGDVLSLEAKMTRARSKIFLAHGEAKVSGEVVAEADLLFSIIDA